MEVEQECTTPKNQDYQIPMSVVCLPAPRKKMERQQTKKNRPKNGYFQSPDIETFFANSPGREALA